MYDAATWEEAISNALTKVNQGSAIKYERVKNFTKENSEEILSLLSDSYKDIPYHKYTFESSPKARRSYLLAGLGKRVDPDVCERDDTNESLSQGRLTTLSASITHSSPISGTANSPITYSSQSSRDDVSAYFEKMFEELPYNVLDWISDVENPAQEVIQSTYDFDKSQAIDVCFMATREESRSHGYGTELLSVITDVAQRMDVPVMLLSATEEAVRFYKKSGFFVNREETGEGKGTLPFEGQEDAHLFALSYIPDGLTGGTDGDCEQSATTDFTANSSQ
ncbi:hypothetical protein I203_107071 [Kwoniella mangroviensis CBS 8507]|uniref:hypothetical protein n=1 Tax=Kwoniella mangroviensis CBS 8507 TaxID=1296122 RepID=UPI00080D784C|nr:uncharacterized protein I203_01819 [Kwoniella mangroviensis CBS 8507]OCF68437.1 hypothetical protein I203_01819 [Kwoniella mangroviensis CBS 8507]